MVIKRKRRPERFTPDYSSDAEEDDADEKDSNSEELRNLMKEAEAADLKSMQKTQANMVKGAASIFA